MTSVDTTTLQADRSNDAALNDMIGRCAAI
jgi:hypothetical protein